MLHEIFLQDASCNESEIVKISIDDSVYMKRKILKFNIINFFCVVVDFTPL